MTSFGEVPPPSSAGYIPPKGGPVRSRTNNGIGWRDSNGNIWYPQTGDRAHGGEHWDGVGKKGNYVNVYPDGCRRKGAGKEPTLPPVKPEPGPTPTITPSPTPDTGNKIDYYEEIIIYEEFPYYSPDLSFEEQLPTGSDGFNLNTEALNYAGGVLIVGGVILIAIFAPEFIPVLLI